MLSEERVMRELNESDLSRFWSKVDKRGDLECWEWKGALSGGYGHIYFQGRLVRAHRASLMIHGFTLPKSLVADHICRNRCCVNPSHLRVVTQRINCLENNSGVSATNAKKTHCPRGHPLSGDNLVSIASRPGNRLCRKCHRIHVTQSRRRRYLGKVDRRLASLLERIWSKEVDARDNDPQLSALLQETGDFICRTTKALAASAPKASFAEGSGIGELLSAIDAWIADGTPETEQGILDARALFYSPDIDHAGLGTDAK